MRALASAVVDRNLLSFMGIAPEHEHEASEILDRHLAQFAVDDEAKPDVYEYPLAFMVYEARCS